MTSWFRSWHGAPTDNKYILIGQKAGVAPGIVSAIVWALCDHASQHEERGSIQGFDAETYAAFSGFTLEQVEAVIKALTDKGVIQHNALSSWDKRQPKREDDGAAERKKKQRQKDDVTQRHATSRTVPPQIQIQNTETDIKDNYYNFLFSGEPFAGAVINLDPDAFNLLFQTYSNGDERKFREMIANRDDWYSTQSYSIQRNWLPQTTKWLQKNMNGKKPDGFKRLG